VVFSEFVMNTTRVRAAILGTGFMGRVHLEAVRRLGFVDAAAVAGSTLEKARAFADAFGVERAASAAKRFSSPSTTGAARSSGSRTIRASRPRAAGRGC